VVRLAFVNVGSARAWGFWLGLRLVMLARLAHGDVGSACAWGCWQASTTSEVRVPCNSPRQIRIRNGSPPRPSQGKTDTVSACRFTRSCERGRPVLQENPTSCIVRQKKESSVGARGMGPCTRFATRVQPRLGLNKRWVLYGSLSRC
jgi:hypothetical protein